MTDKRFTIDYEANYKEIMYLDKDNVMTEKEVLNTLNELHEENIKLNNFKKKVFELINKKIKHYQHEPISAPVIQPLSINFDHEQDRLARLSELQQLLKELEE